MWDAEALPDQSRCSKRKYFNLSRRFHTVELIRTRKVSLKPKSGSIYIRRDE